MPAEIDNSMLMYDMTRPKYESISTTKDLKDFVRKIEFKNHWGERVDAYMAMNKMIASGQRPGQAFMNVIDEADYHKLTGTLLDPFNKMWERDVLIALDYLILTS